MKFVALVIGGTIAVLLCSMAFVGMAVVIGKIGGPILVFGCGAVVSCFLLYYALKD